MTAETSAIYLSENLFELNKGSSFLNNLELADRSQLKSAASKTRINQGVGLFNQGEIHSGIWVIEAGRIRTFYSGPSGKEITLAYWSAGHFVGGPEVFGKGRHVWSACAMEDSELLFLKSDTLRKLAFNYPAIAIALIEGLGKQR